MKTADSKCKIDSVEIGEITLVTIGKNIPLTAKFALKAGTSGISYGSGHMTTWGSDTMQKLKDLIESMEFDILKAVFEEGAVEMKPTETTPEEYPEDSVPEL